MRGLLRKVRSQNEFSHPQLGENFAFKQSAGCCGELPVMAVLRRWRGVDREVKATRDPIKQQQQQQQTQPSRGQ